MQLFLPTHNVEERLRHEKQIGTHIVDSRFFYLHTMWKKDTETQCRELKSILEKDYRMGNKILAARRR